MATAGRSIQMAWWAPLWAPAYVDAHSASAPTQD